MMQCTELLSSLIHVFHGMAWGSLLTLMILFFVGRKK